MSDLFRDTVFGHAVRFFTKGTYFQFAEEKDPSIWKQYVDRNQIKNMALYGQPDDGPPEEKPQHESAPISETQSHANGNGIGNGANLSEESSQTRAEDGDQQLSSTMTGQKIDPEKGRDVTRVTWFGDKDPEVQMLRDRVEDEAGAKQAVDALKLVNIQEMLCHI